MTEHTPPTADEIAEQLRMALDAHPLEYNVGYRAALKDLLAALKSAALPESPSAAPTTDELIERLALIAADGRVIVVPSGGGFRVGIALNAAGSWQDFEFTERDSVREALSAAVAPKGAHPAPLNESFQHQSARRPVSFATTDDDGNELPKGAHDA